MSPPPPTRGPRWQALGLAAITTLLSAVALAQNHAIISQMRRERSVLQQLQQLSEHVLALEQQIDDTRQDVSQLGYEIGEAARRIAVLEQRTTIQREHVQRRARALYKMSQGGLLRLIFDNQHRGDWASRLAAARLILARDARELALHHRELTQLRQRRSILQLRQAQLQRLEQALQRDERALAEARAAQLHALRRLQRDHADTAQLAAEYSEQERGLMRQIATLTRQARSGGGFAGRRGELPRPVRGSIVGVFGRSVANRDNQEVEVLRHGLTFQPEPGARVRAVAPGKVRLAGPLLGFGKLVVLEHDSGYFTLYGFLSAILVQVGSAVAEGTVIGRAGRDPLSGEPAMYFELRRGEQPLDPAVWLSH